MPGNVCLPSSSMWNRPSGFQSCSLTRTWGASLVDHSTISCRLRLGFSASGRTISHHHHHHERRLRGGSVSNRHKEERSPPNVDGGLASIEPPQLSSRFLNEDCPINTNIETIMRRTTIEITIFSRGVVVGNGLNQTVHSAISAKNPID